MSHSSPRTRVLSPPSSIRTSPPDTPMMRAQSANNSPSIPRPSPRLPPQQHPNAANNGGATSLRQRRNSTSTAALIGEETTVTTATTTASGLPTPASIAASGIASLPRPAKAEIKLVRLLRSVWPLPLQSLNTLAILLGLLLLILVMIDEFVWLLVAPESTKNLLAPILNSASSSSSPQSLEDLALQPAFILHLLRYSFAYRCLLCSVWIAVNFAHGLYLNGRKKRIGGARRRRAASGANNLTKEVLSPASEVDSTSSTPHAASRKSVSFAESELAATSVADIVPPTTVSTKKRLRLFFYLGLSLAICGIAFEFYLAVFVNKPGSVSYIQSSVTETINITFLTVLHSFSSTLFSILARVVLVGMWCAFCCFCAYHLWYRKAIGTRKTRGATRTRNRLSPGLEEEDDYTDDDEEYEEEEENESDAMKLSDRVQAPPLAHLSAPGSNLKLPAASSSTSTTSSPYDDDTSDASDYSDSESEEGGSSTNVSSFPIPTAAQLLMFEKLDASLFFHPEQEQNQFQNAVIVDGTGTSSLSLKSSNTSSTPSSPAITVPVSSSSPLLHSTLYHLASTKFLANLAKDDFVNILPEVSWKHVRQGATIYAKGDRSDGRKDLANGQLAVSEEEATDGMYIVVSGTVGVLNPHSVTPHILLTFHQGDSIGELEFLFSHLPRAFTLIALTPSQLLRIPSRLAFLWQSHIPSLTSKSSSSSAHSSILDIPASATPTLTYANVASLGGFSAGVQSMLRMQDQPRSDILLSFIRTTLARQWRSAEYTLHQFLHLPLPPSDAELRISPSTSSTPVVGPSSRYFHPSFASFFSTSSPFFQSLATRTANQLELSPSAVLFEEDSYRSDQLFVVLSGMVVMTSTREPSNISRELGPGSVLNAISYLTDTTHSHTVRAGSSLVRVAWLTRTDLTTPNADILRLAHTVCEVLAPTLAQFQSLGFERKWIRSGTLVYRESQPCDCVYIISSGRVRIATGKLKKSVRRRTSAGGKSQANVSSSSSSSKHSILQAHPSGYDLSIFIERDNYQAFQRTATTSSAARLKPNNSTKRIRFELGRGELVGEVSFLSLFDDAASVVSPPSAPRPAGLHSSSALCTKDAELLKISRACFENLITSYPRVLLKFAQILGRRLNEVMSSTTGLHPLSVGADKSSRSVMSSVPRSPWLAQPSSSVRSTCMSVCILSASPLVDLGGFALSLSVSLSAMGRTMLLTPNHVDRTLGEGTCANLNSYYHRSLFQYWLSHVESLYSFCLFVTDSAITPWTSQCQRQADLCLIVASSTDDPEDDADDEEDEQLAAIQDQRRMRAKRVSQFEKLLVWNGGERAIIKQQQRKKLQQQHQHEVNRAATSDTIRPSTTPSFSPTLHPDPIPGNTHSTSSPQQNRASSSATSSCYPRLQFSLRDLVLLHPPSSALPRGTRFWVAQRPNLHRFHHMQLDSTEHFDRLARYCAGRTVGVILSGGGARGLSHLGVLNSFAEQKVPIDYIGGTSQGSFMSALYASQPLHHTRALAQMATRVHTLAVTMGSIASLLTDATFPMLSYFAGRKFGANIASILGEHTRIEDLWLPFFLCTTNLSQADMTVHTVGSLWKAVRASMTVLDYLPPMQISKKWPDLLIDGGYTNNLPVDVCHDLYQPCYVIGVDVENKSCEEKLSRTSYFGPHLSGWWLVRTRIYEWLRAGWLGNTLRRVKSIYSSQPVALAEPLNLPMFSELISSLLYINHNRNIRTSLDNQLIDLYIRPDLGTIALLDYHLESSIVEIGYSATKVKLTEWRLRNPSHPKATSIDENTITAASHSTSSSSSSSSSSTAAAAAGTSSMIPVPLQRLGSNSLASVPPFHISQSPRRKNSAGSSHAHSRSFVPPASLTFTRDLLSASTSSPIMRSTPKQSVGYDSLHPPFMQLDELKLGDSNTSTPMRQTQTQTTSHITLEPIVASPQSGTILENLHAESSPPRPIEKRDTTEAAAAATTAATAPASSSSTHSRSSSQDDLALASLKPVTPELPTLRRLVSEGSIEPSPE